MLCAFHVGFHTTLVSLFMRTLFHGYGCRSNKLETRENNLRAVIQSQHHADIASAQVHSDDIIEGIIAIDWPGKLVLSSEWLKVTPPRQPK